MSLKIENIDKYKISYLNLYAIETYHCKIRQFPDSSTPQ